MKRIVWALAIGCALGMTGVSQGASAAPPAEPFGAGAKVVREPLSGAVRGVFGLKVATEGEDLGRRALGFVEARRRALGLGEAALIVKGEEALPNGRGHVVRLGQTVLGVPVEGRSLAVRMDGEGNVRGVNSDLVPFSIARPERALDAEAAMAVVRERYEVTHVGRPSEVVLVSAPHVARLAWKVPVAVIPLMAHFWVFVDAESGEVLREALAGHDMPVTRLPRKEGAR